MLFQRSAMLLARVFITFLFCINATFTENIEITRKIPRENKNRLKWKEGYDSFFIPQSACNRNGSQYGDYCLTVCDTEETNDGHRYSCSCPADNATLTFHNNQWRCRENVEVRKQLGCEKNNLLFNNEKEADQLRMLTTTPRRQTKLKRQECDINNTTSWYIGCNGEKLPLQLNTNTFILHWDDSKSKCFLKVQNVEPIELFRGRVINLGIRWSSPDKQGCLLFKLEGNISCPVEKPPSFGSSSVVVPTTSSSYNSKTTKPTSTPSTVKKKPFSKTAKPKTNPSQASFQPSSGVQQRHVDANPSSPVGLITGVTVSIAVVLLLIAALFWYRRHKSRKDAHTSSSGGSEKKILEKSAHTNTTLQPEVQNGYVTSSSKKLGNSPCDEMYASLDVPEGYNIYGPGNAQEPFYNVLQESFSGNQEDGQNYGTIRLEQPMYNVLEDLSGMGPVKAEQDGPSRVEPVYNVLEEPYPGNAERSEHYGAISVNDPFYNTLEESQGRSGPQGTNDEPVYNTLEEPYPSGAAEDDTYGPRGLQDPVYNVLEGPSTDNIDSNIPTYAVVHKKKR